MAIILTVFIAVLSVTKSFVIDYIPVLKGILWILRSVMLPAEIYGNAEYFKLEQSVFVFIKLFVYGTVYSVIKSLICRRNRF